MAMFRDEKEALRRLEEALQEEEASEEEYDTYEDDGAIENFAPDVSRIRIRNTDRTDLDPEELSKRLHKPRFTLAAVLLLLAAAVTLCGLLLYVLRYL